MQTFWNGLPNFMRQANRASPSSPFFRVDCRIDLQPHFWLHTRSNHQTRTNHFNKKLANPECLQQTHHLTHHPLLYVKLCVPSCWAWIDTQQKKWRRPGNSRAQTWAPTDRTPNDPPDVGTVVRLCTPLKAPQQSNWHGHRREPVYSTHLPHQIPTTIIQRKIHTEGETYKRDIHMEGYTHGSNMYMKGCSHGRNMHTEGCSFGGIYTWRRYIHKGTTKQRNMYMEGTFTRRMVHRRTCTCTKQRNIQLEGTYKRRRHTYRRTSTRRKHTRRGHTRRGHAYRGSYTRRDIYREGYTGFGVSQQPKAFLSSTFFRQNSSKKDSAIALLLKKKEKTAWQIHRFYKSVSGC